MLVSPQHRVLMSDEKTSLLFDDREVLVAAKHLIGHDRIHRAGCDEVEYFHLLFERHQIIFSEGIPSESFDPMGDYARADHEVRTEVLRLFPELAVLSTAARPTVRRVLKRAEAEVLVS